MKKKLEIIGFNIESCLTAQQAGADRIELCDSPGEGGTTPSYGFIKAAREKLNIELYVMIRPRGGDFLYTEDEYNIMKSDVEICKQLNCDGIVFGILTSDGKVDKKRCREIIGLAYPLAATFHRAFDRVSDAAEALEDVIGLGFERILTSGLLPKASDGMDTLSAMVTQANERIIIMPGSGVNANNIVSIAGTTGAKEFHSSASTTGKSNMNYQNSKMNETPDHVMVNAGEVKKMKDILASMTEEK